MFKQIPKAAFPILLLTFVNAIGGTLLIPVLPFVVRDFGQSDFVFALLIAAYPAAQFFAAPVLGSLADHYGRRPILLVSQAGTLASWVILGSAYFVSGSAGWGIGLIAFSRVVDGLTGGNASVAAAFLADVVEEKARTQVFSMQGVVAGVALLFGPALGSYSAASSIGFLGPAILATLLSGATLVWMMASLTESLPVDQRSSEFDANPLHQLNLIGKARTLTGKSALYRLFTTQALFTMTFSGYTTILALWYVDRLGVSESGVGLMMLAVGVFLIFNELVVLRFVEKHLSDVGTLLLGLSILPVALFLVRLPSSIITFLPLAFLVNLGMALVLPTLQSVVTQASDKKETGQVQGINTSVSAISSALAPIAAGAAYTVLGGGVTILLASVVAAVAAGTSLASRHLLLAATGEATSESGRHHEHRQHGPICSLANKVAGGRRSFGLNIQGSARQHHGLGIKVERTRRQS